MTFDGKFYFKLTFLPLGYNKSLLYLKKESIRLSYKYIVNIEIIMILNFKFMLTFWPLNILAFGYNTSLLYKKKEKTSRSPVHPSVDPSIQSSFCPSYKYIVNIEIWFLNFDFMYTFLRLKILAVGYNTSLLYCKKEKLSTCPVRLSDCTS